MALVSGSEYVYSDSNDETQGARRRVIEDIIYSQDPIDLPLRDYFGGYEASKAKGIKEEHVEQANLEDVFIDLTGKGLREE